MRVFFGAFIAALVIVSGSSVLAQSEDGKPPLLTPTSGWLVGPASLAAQADAKEKLPCVMLNQYDNGFSLRISGGDRKVQAIAIDFHQNVFTPGESYGADVWIGSTGRNLQAMAFSETTLIVNTSAIENFYDLLSVEKTLRFAVEGKEFEFMLLGTADGLRRVEECYAGGGVSPAREQEARPDIAPQTQRQAEMTPLPADSLPGFQTKTMGGDEAGKKNSPAQTKIDEMLQGVAGKIEDKPQIKPPAQVADAPAEKPPQEHSRDVVVSGDGDPESNTMEKRWRVMRGARLHEVLETWAEKENVELLWLAGQDFPVPRSVSIQGTFDAAVANILGQYGDGKARPVGRIYIDPSLGKKVLVIELKQKL